MYSLVVAIRCGELQSNKLDLSRGLVQYLKAYGGGNGGRNKSVMNERNVMVCWI